MNKLYYLIIGLSVIGFQSLAQEKENQWDFKLGYENIRLLDRQNSPLVYSAHAGVVSVDFSSIKPQSVWGLSLSTAIGNSQAKRFGQRIVDIYDDYDIYGEREFSTVYGNPALSYVHIHLAYAYQRKVVISHKNFQVGAKIGNDFFLSGIGLDTWFFNNLSLSPLISTQFELKNGSRIPVKLSFPIASYVVREPFGKDPSIPLDNYIEANIKTGASMATLDKFQKIEFTAGYRSNWQSKWNLGLDYTFYWYHYAKPDHLRTYSNQFTLVLYKKK